MKAITFLLYTKQPILLTSLQGDPNSDVSFAYIPGSVIRGVLISRYIQRHNVGRNDDILNDEQFPDVGRLFFNGETRFLNGYLYSKQSEKRTLPVPLSWLKKKADDINKLESQEISIYDFSCQQPDDDSYKSLDAGFCIVEDQDILLYQEKRRINIHNMRNRKKGRGIDGDGAVFRYDALDVGQVFQSVILCNNSDDVEEIKSLLQPENVWLGGSISAGYGNVCISDIQECDDWCEVGIEPDERDFEEENLIRITLLSDLILRDEYGNYVLTPPQQLLEELLKVKLCLKSCFIGNHIVGGFNKKWGLPLPQIPVLSAGSVFVFECDRDNLDIEKIRYLEEQGIGERRVDGFGRVAVNWLDDYSIFTATVPKEDKQDIGFNSPQSAENSEDSKIAIIMAKRLLQQKLDKRLLEKVTSIKLKPNKLTNSQLSRLMIVARQSLTEENNTAIIKFLEKLPKNAKSQFEETKIYSKTLNTQICEWLKDPNSWIDSHHVEISIAGKQVSPDIVEKLKAEYTRLLIIAVAKQAIKQQQKI